MLENPKQEKQRKYSKTEIKSVDKVIRQRSSKRIYAGGVDRKTVKSIIDIAGYAPSSCNRHGVYLKKLNKRVVKMLIGGKGWAEKGTAIGLYADMKAYKSEYETDFMPYLDAGVIIQTIYLYCEVNGIRCCYVNPNTYNKYNPKHLFCGAIIVGI